MKETDLAARVIDWLTADGWDVHQEVMGADIVAVKNATSWIIECKLGLGLDVLAQALDWLPTGQYGILRRQACNLVSVAAPLCRASRARRLAAEIAKERGLGILQVRRNPEEWAGIGVEEWIPPKCFLVSRESQYDIRNCLCEETKTYANAGSPGGKCWTPFKATAQKAREYIKANPGASVREIVESIEHHYASDVGARSGLLTGARNGWVEDVRLDEAHRPIRWYAEAV